MGKKRPAPGPLKIVLDLLATRERVVADWKRTAGVLSAQGQESLAREVEGYVRRMPAWPPRKSSSPKNYSRG
jgi:hypothetical protein